jgi:hypothetical protein
MASFRQQINSIMEEYYSSEELSTVRAKVRKDTLLKLKGMIGSAALTEVKQYCDMFTCDWTKEYPASQKFCRSTGASKVFVQQIDGQLRILTNASP